MTATATPASANGRRDQENSDCHHGAVSSFSRLLSLAPALSRVPALLRSVSAIFLRHSDRAVGSEASQASSLGVGSSTSASAAFFSRGPQCPHCAACFISSLVFGSGSSPAATSSHSSSRMHSGVGGDGLGTRIRKISLCTNSCLCSLRLQSWQDSTWRWASLRAGSESCSEPDTLVPCNETRLSSSSLSRCLSNGRVKICYSFYYDIDRRNHFRS